MDVGVLEAAATAISASVSDQRGTRLDQVDGAADTYGHDGVHQALEGFCGRWNAGFDLLLDDAEAISGLLSAVARAYREADAASAGRLTADPARPVVDD
ncbi:hypothetical protein [Paractinoplanes ferrugineus]|uniref:hypothetical protein n=1 Tax=Paractinoplanes ferrugineus TaxID=113564 RepID=UPI001EF22E77|nr:hypothetical protein [Actinoplanes ferrugineus]